MVLYSCGRNPTACKANIEIPLSGMVVRSSYGYEEFWLLNRWEASPPVRPAKVGSHHAGDVLVVSEYGAVCEEFDSILMRTLP